MTEKILLYIVIGVILVAAVLVFALLKRNYSQVVNLYDTIDKNLNIYNYKGFVKALNEYNIDSTICSIKINNINDTENLDLLINVRDYLSRKLNKYKVLGYIGNGIFVFVILDGSKINIMDEIQDVFRDSSISKAQASGIENESTLIKSLNKLFNGNEIIVNEPKETIVKEIINVINVQTQEEAKDYIEEVVSVDTQQEAKEEALYEEEEEIEDDNEGYIIEDFSIISETRQEVLSDFEIEDMLNKKVYEKKCFIEKLLNLDYVQKDNYNLLKNTIMRYENIKNRTSNSYDTFLYKNKVIIKLGVMGKSIRLYLALDPNNYEKSKFPHKDVSDKIRHKNTPYMMKISSNLSVKRAGKLINELLTSLSLENNNDYENINYVRNLHMSVKKGD